MKFEIARCGDPQCLLCRELTKGERAMTRAIGGIFLMSLNNYNLHNSRVEATCSCGQPVAGMVIKDTYDPVEVRHFFADTFRLHIGAHPSGHGLSLEIHELAEQPSATDANKG